MLSLIRFLKSILIVILLFSCSDNQKAEHARQRIISLAPNITEVLFALDLGEQVVAVSDFCNYPPQAKNKESIGGLLNPNLEKITALRPDLLIATESYRTLADKLGNKDFLIVLLPEKTVNDVYVTIDSLGTLFQREKKADSLITAIKDSLNFYRVKDTTATPSAMLVLGRSENTTRNISISSTGAFINELWEYCGGRNAFADIGSSFATLNREDLLKRDPQLIIEFKSSKNWSLEQDEANKKEWQDLNISAVKKGQIYVINGNDFLIPGPRMFRLAKKYNRIIKQYQTSQHR